uniref:CUB domain-containing protein n=1 Tax=Poecilia mexicana TaxID=48701 RepID=A0A3B3YJS7_9TELE
MWLKLTFILHFPSLNAASCGGTYIGQTGEIHSPGFPGSNYPKNSNFAPNRRVTLIINDLPSSSCRYDYVAVYDGPDSLAPLLGRFCGTVLPPDIRSSTNNLFIIFSTDATVSGVGWRATYSQTLVLGAAPPQEKSVGGFPFVWIVCHNAV